MAGHVINPSTKFEDPMAIRSWVELWVLTSPIGYYWQCVCSHCACAVSRNLCRPTGANFSNVFEISYPDLPIHCTTFMALRLKQMELSAKTVYGAMLKITQRSAHAQNHVSVQRCRKSFTTVVLGDHDFPLTGLNFGKLTAFRAIMAQCMAIIVSTKFEVDMTIRCL